MVCDTVVSAHNGSCSWSMIAARLHLVLEPRGRSGRGRGLDGGSRALELHFSIKLYYYVLCIADVCEKAV